MNQPWKLCARNSIQGFSLKLTKLIIALVLEVLPAKLLGPGGADLFTITSDNSRTYIDIWGYLFFSDIDRTRRSLELGLKGKQEEPRKNKISKNTNTLYLGNALVIENKYVGNKELHISY